MPLTSTTLLLSSEAPSFFEDQVTFSISVTGGGPTPTGNVILSDSLDPGGNFGGPYTLPLDGSGNASIIINTMNPGLHVLTAAYQGDGTYGTSSHMLTQQVIDVVEPTAIVPGFSLIASFTTLGDTDLTPQAELTAIPASAPAHTSITLLWTVLNVPKIEITGPGGFDTGIIVTAGTGAFVIGNGLTATSVFVLAALDASGAPLLVNGSPLVATATATVT